MPDFSGFNKPALLDEETPEHSPTSLYAVLLPTPSVSPDDSLARLLQVLRRHSADCLPVTSSGRLVGMASHVQVSELLTRNAAEALHQTLRRPVSDIMREPDVVIAPNVSLDALKTRTLAYGLLSCLPVVDTDGYCLGMVHPCDLLGTPAYRPRLPTIGGMATPFGVYLTDGTNQAGVGNLALVASGAMTAVLLLFATEVAQHALIAMGAAWHLPYARVLDLDYSPPVGEMWNGILSLALRAALIALFLTLMRLSMLAGFHAAEHQTVHALEAGEELAPEIVARMPRAHPRCGTNLLAALMLFTTMRSLLEYIPATRSINDFLAAAITLFSWRRFGTWLQERFTTRTPTLTQIASGIAAGRALLNRYATAPPSRPKPLLRLWCSGILQSFIGMLIVAAAVWLVSQIWPQLHL